MSKWKGVEGSGQVSRESGAQLRPHAPVGEPSIAPAGQQRLVPRPGYELQGAQDGVVGDGLWQRGCVQDSAITVCSRLGVRVRSVTMAPLVRTAQLLMQGQGCCCAAPNMQC